MKLLLAEVSESDEGAMVVIILQIGVSVSDEEKLT